jgi:hypothetical protein
MINPLYTLGDAVELHRQHPETFALCSKEDRESLRVGDVAQLSFDVPGFKTERMWVLVVGRFRNKYIGTINNAPIQPSFPLAFGDKLTFSARNIYQLAQVPPVPKDSPFLAEEAELARQMNKQQTPTTDACAHCGEHGAECIEHTAPARGLVFQKIWDASRDELFAAAEGDGEDATKAFISGMKAAWARGDYQTVAQAGSRHGRYFMSDQVGKVPNGELGFAPEFYIFDENGDFGVVAAPQLDAKGFSRLLQALFEGKFPFPEGVKMLKPEGILVIRAGYFSKTCRGKLESIADPDVLKKEFEERPYSSYPDKITCSEGCVYLAPDQIVASAGVAVGTEEELTAAGFGERKAA